MVQMPCHRNYLLFFLNSKLSHVQNTLLQKQQCKFPNFSSWYNNNYKGKVQAMKVHRQKCTAPLTLNPGTRERGVVGFLLGTL